MFSLALTARIHGNKYGSSILAHSWHRLASVSYPLLKLPLFPAHQAAKSFGRWHLAAVDKSINVSCGTAEHLRYGGNVEQLG